MFELYSCAVGSGVHVHNYVMLLYLDVTLFVGEENDNNYDDFDCGVMLSSSTLPRGMSTTLTICKCQSPDGTMEAVSKSSIL